MSTTNRTRRAARTPAARLVDELFRELDPLFGVCPDCGGDLAEWGPGETVCIDCTGFRPAGPRRPTPPAPALRRAA